MSYKNEIESNKVPEHVAIIMDGNGRWAQQRGNDRSFGHEHGVDAVRSVVEGAAEVGVKYMTLYAFSTENWNRPQGEVNALMALLVHAINEETETLDKNNVRFHTIGDTSSLPQEVQNRLNFIKNRLKDNTGLNLVIALSYSSKWEITQAVKQIAHDAKEGVIAPDEVNEQTISNYLNTADFPDPELMVRTSGEQRISNFLLWQLAYAELYFTPKLWPDFRKEDLFEAIYQYQQRERRFGKTSEQIQEKNA
ncbi:isoprenyl transferase [Prolixibacteraceae bacterium JC049]|nr:isoprenyl transferase [Prolixibacteraceae bacterium JC049]